MLQPFTTVLGVIYDEQGQPRSNLNDGLEATDGDRVTIEYAHHARSRTLSRQSGRQRWKGDAQPPRVGFSRGFARPPWIPATTRYSAPRAAARL